MSDPLQLLGFGRSSDDYEVPPTGPSRESPPGGVATALTALGALTVGFLLATGLSAGREEALAQGERRDELIALITERQEHADELGEEVEELRARVDEAQARAAAAVPALQSEIAAIELAAGLADLRGPGVRVTLSDAPTSCDARPSDCRIQDFDIQLAVNTLFEVGAEAVAVGGERVTATTAVRSAGQTVLANLSVLSSPYEIEAVGDPQALFEGLDSSDLARDFDDWSQDYGLGFELERADDLVLPRYGGGLSVDARPVGDTAEVDG